MAPPASISAYIAGLPEGARVVAESIREAIRSAVPACEEAIRYGIPAFSRDGRTFVYFAVWKKHVGLYPVYRGSEAFERAVGPYRARKDTIQFKLDEPIKLDLVALIAAEQLKAQSAGSRARAPAS